MAGLHLGLPKGCSGLQATGGRAGDPCGPAPFFRSHRALAVAMCPEGSPCIHSRCPGTPQTAAPPQNSLSPQEALRETSCCPELLAYWGCYPEWDRTLPEKQLEGGESLRERGREGQETGLAEGGGGQLHGVGASPSPNRASGWCLVAGVARLSRDDPPLWRPEPSWELCPPSEGKPGAHVSPRQLWEGRPLPVSASGAAAIPPA